MKENKIKYLSLIGPDTKTSYGIMSQIYKNCDMSEHRFVVLANKDCLDRFPKLYEFDNLIFMPKGCSRFTKIKFLYDLLKQSDHIIVHSLFFTTYKFMLFFWFFRAFLKKAVWIEWGADLYLWKLPETSLKNKIKNHIGKVVRQNFSAVGVTFPVDEEEFRAQFGYKTKVFYTPMPNPIFSAKGLMDKIDSLNPENTIVDTIVPLPEESNDQNQVENIDIDYEQLWKDFIDFVVKNRLNGEEKDSIGKILTDYIDSLKPTPTSQTKEEIYTPIEEEEEKKIYRIQVAHNSFSFNHHVKLLNYLYKFKSDNVRLVLPMTYGSSGINGSFGGKDYPQTITKYGKGLFGNKLRVMTNNISFEEYVKYLWTIDIAVFDFDRPCGLGNIRILLYMGKKVFLPSNNSFYNFLLDKGIKIYDTNDIPNMTFEEFVAPPTDTDLSWIKDYLNNDSVIKHWVDMFKELDRDDYKK